MDRREFFKGMFGVAIVAAIPKQVMDQIVETPIPVEPESACLSVPKQSDYFNKPFMFIYNNTGLIGYSYMITLEVKIERGMFGSDAPLVMYPDWTIRAENIIWKKDPREYFESDKALQCVIKDKELEIIGDAYIQSMDINVSTMDYINCSAEFRGTGCLDVTNWRYEDSEITKFIGATERTKVTTRQVNRIAKR